MWIDKTDKKCSGIYFLRNFSPSYCINSWHANTEHASKLMNEHDYRILAATNGKVQCLPEKIEPVENCGFCIHCREFGIGSRFVKSPSLAYCTKCRITEKVDLTRVTAVKCADRQSEGFHSITSIISWFSSWRNLRRLILNIISVHHHTLYFVQVVPCLGLLWKSPVFFNKHMVIKVYDGFFFQI